MTHLTPEQFDELIARDADLAYDRFKTRLDTNTLGAPYTEEEIEAYENLLCEFGFVPLTDLGEALFGNE